jgi:hypothetical protein
MTTETKLAYLDGLPVSELLRRGWTQGLIEKLLGAPDQLERNPHYRGLAQQRYVKSHKIPANCRGVKDFRRFRNSVKFQQRYEKRHAKCAMARSKGPFRCVFFEQG